MTFNYGMVQGNYQGAVSEFYIRLNNTTGSPVVVNSLNNLFLYGQTISLLSATVELNGVITDIKLTNNTVSPFTVQNGESGIVMFKWVGGVPCLMGQTNNSYRMIQRSQGCKLYGTTAAYLFMSNLFNNCPNYNQQVGDVFNFDDYKPTLISDDFMYQTFLNCSSLTNVPVFNTSHWKITGGIAPNFMYWTFRNTPIVTPAIFDTSGWRPTTIGNSFMRGTWSNCMSMTTSVFPDVSNWNITSIGEYFMQDLWNGDFSMTNQALPDTSNWNITSIPNYFLQNTYRSCASVSTYTVPDVSNWRPTSIGQAFLQGTWYGCSMQTAIVPDTSLWNVTTLNLAGLLSQTWQQCTQLRYAAVPDTSNWHVTGSQEGILNNTWNGCSNLISAQMIDTSNWTINNSIGSSFMGYTFMGCSALTTQLVPDTSNWSVTTIVHNFMQNTFNNCSNLNTCYQVNTSNWNVTSIGNAFMGGTYSGCTSQTTQQVFDSSNWNVTSIGTGFMQYTYVMCNGLTNIELFDTRNWVIPSVGQTFLSDTLSISSGTGKIITLKGSLYTGIQFPFTPNSLGLNNQLVTNIKVDSALIPTYQGSPSWTNITGSKFISW